MIKKQIILVTLFVIFAQTSAILAGTTGKVAGKIEDKATKEALPGANVAILGTSLGAITGIDGNYYILNIPPGTYELKVSMVGYTPVTVTEVRVKIDQTTMVNCQLESAVIKGEEVTVVAEKPKVEFDLTASKQAMSANDVNRSWGTELSEVISDLPGVNVHGGIRGGYGLDVAYNLNGMDMRDVGSNTNFSLINLTTIQEVEVLTGGFNAEYGQANGAIVNIVTRSATDRLHGVVQYKFRPAGKYHWGDHIFAEDGIYRGIMTTPEFWDPSATWQTQWMDEPMKGYDGGRAPYRQMTPEQRAEYWEAFVNDEARFPHMNYTDRMEWETEISLYGPITKKMSFLLSGRYKEGVAKFPASLKYNPDMTFQGMLDYRLNASTKLSLSGIFTKFNNSGPPRTFFQSSEETTGQFIDQELSYLRNPYNAWTFWLYGNKGNSDLWTIRPPERAEFYNFQLKGTHVFNPNTFLDVALQHNFMEYRMDYREIAKGAYFEGFGLPTVELSESGYDTVYVAGWPDDHWGQAPPRSFVDFRWGYPGDTWRNWVDTRSTSIKADLTSQISHTHLLKTGFILSSQMYDKLLHEGRSSAAGESPRASVNDIVSTKTTPYEGGFYVQDKMEFQGLVVNAGVRVDFFNPNRRVAKDFFDPYFINDQYGVQGQVRYDPNGPDSLYRDTPTKWAVSPRLGISHPISENTVLHFMFGIFNQRPSWQKILANPVVYVAPLPDGVDSDLDIPDSTIISYRSYSQRT
ncbi:carboxypeptidase-like regulatory domain-containing protein, partial [candidate division KSB1 bacterium]|nr:carboxypeptidase-like regulatory domain-containing protein [candidate division KSB1 bacterium]